jgi:hypothetical protein
VKHSVNIKKREKIVGDLRHWNQDLKGCLEKSEVPAEDESQKVQDLKRRFNPKRCDALRQSLDSLHGALGSVFTCDCTGPSHEAAIDLDWVSYELATNPIKVAVLSKADMQAGDCRAWRRLHATPESDIRPSLNGPPTPVVTPDRIPSPKSTPLKTKAVSFSMLRALSRTTPEVPSVVTTTVALESLEVHAMAEPTSRLTDLCTAVCSGHVTSTKRGLIEDPCQEEHFSIWHSKERHEIKEKIPIKSLLSRTSAGPHQRKWPMLSAKERYGLAVSIAWSVLHLGDSPWLRDLWDKEQMGVFIENRNQQEFLSRFPCTSSTFGSATDGTETPAADKFYNHVSHKNVFLLGVLLVELCTNEPITGSGSILDVYEAARNKLEEVCCTAGNSYGYAAERCIKFAFEGRESYRQFCFSTFRQQFHDVVLAPIKATYLMFPDSYGPL